MFNLFALLAEFERNIICERAAQHHPRRLPSSASRQNPHLQQDKTRPKSVSHSPASAAPTFTAISPI
jgi:hypothetical protein